MATTRGCEAEIFITLNGVRLPFNNLRNFGISASSSSESTAVLGNNCVNKGASSSKELTGSSEYCYDCDDPAHVEIKCGETYPVEWYPKGEDFVSPNTGITPQWIGEIEFSSSDVSSNADDAIMNIPMDFSIISVTNTNLPL